MTNCKYLQDEGCKIEGFHFWGSPWQPEFGRWAFNLPRGEKLREKWDEIPDNTDVLITHSPPYGIKDLVVTGKHEGCEELLKVVFRIKPKLHIFGHIHEDYGKQVEQGITFVNASICNFDYESLNNPIVVDI